MSDLILSCKELGWLIDWLQNSTKTWNMEQAPQTHPGGLGGEKPATSDIQQLCDMVSS